MLWPERERSVVWQRKGTHLMVFNYFKTSGYWTQRVPEHGIPHPWSETWKELSDKGEVKA